MRRDLPIAVCPVAVCPTSVCPGTIGPKKIEPKTICVSRLWPTMFAVSALVLFLAAPLSAHHIKKGESVTLPVTTS